MTEQLVFRGEEAALIKPKSLRLKELYVIDDSGDIIDPKIWLELPESRRLDGGGRFLWQSEYEIEPSYLVLKIICRKAGTTYKVVQRPPILTQEQASTADNILEGFGRYFDVCGAYFTVISVCRKLILRVRVD